MKYDSLSYTNLETARLKSIYQLLPGTEAFAHAGVCQFLVHLGHVGLETAKSSFQRLRLLSFKAQVIIAVYTFEVIFIRIIRI